MNRKGQFSIIAAMLVAVVLVAAVMTTYAAIRYNPLQDQPQMLSAIDEINLALKQVLGFTVGYYGSVLQVTGNSSYAKMLATDYMLSGLQNIGDIRPEWSPSFNVNSLDLGTNWFTNTSYSTGTLTVTFDLTGLGIYGMTYSTSCRLDVQVLKSPSSSQASLSITKDGNEPLINLGKQNLKFYRYNFSSSTWDFVSSNSEPTAFANGTYLVDIPSGVDSSSYFMKIEDTRGIMVVASSFSRYTSKLAWNTTSVEEGFHYVDNAISNVDSSIDKGTHSNFTAQQYGPDSIYDVLTEAVSGAFSSPSYPSYWNAVGSTTLAGGTTASLQSNDGSYMSFHSYVSAFASPTTFGYNTKGATASTFNYVRGSRFTVNQGGLANSISAYMSFTSSSNTFGNSGTGSSGDSIIDTIRGQQFQSPSSPVVAQSISAYIYCSTSAKNMNAAIYDSSGNLVAAATQRSISAGTSWQTFTFASPPTLAASTNYVLVVWSQSGSGSGDLRYSSSSGGSGRTAGQTYGSWPSSVSFSTNNRQYSVYCNYLTTFKAQAAIYSSGGTFMASTEEKTLTTTNGWVTFNFISQPLLAGSTNYVLAIECSDTSNVNVYYDVGTAEYYRGTSGYPTWPSLGDQGSQRTYGIYCTYTPATEFTAGVEFTGQSNTPTPWNDLIWAIDSSATTSGVSVIFQLYNFQTGSYPSSGDGYMTDTIGTTDRLNTQTIAANPTSFRNSTGYWKLKFTAVKSTSTQFDMKIDIAQFTPEATNYAVDLEEQWVNVNYTNPRQDLCIKTGSLGSENLMVDVWHGGSWHNLIAGLVSGWNNVSVTSYMDSSTFYIRFKGSNDVNDNTPDTWNIDAVFLKNQPNVDFISSLQESTFVVEMLQNGTMNWLGQNLKLTTNAMPIPPISAKAIHVNQTINGVNQEVPFQIEDWASGYTIPLGLTNNATVLGNRQMIVFIANNKVSEFKIWWNGSDEAAQTPFAFTNRYFTDDPSTRTLSNGRLSLHFTSGFTLTSTVVGTSTTSTETFMRINSDGSDYGAGEAYVVHHGVVRDIVQQEAEWDGGVANCPNLYANIVLTLPANVTYFTYQLRLMFINSTQPRTITDLCPIQVSSAIGSLTPQSENGTIGGFPIVVNGTGLFSNYTSGSWTPHHWSQLISGTKGTGIMFTDNSNLQLYVFDSVAGNPTGALSATSTSLIELLPVKLNQAQFTYPLDITWNGAVATFDNTTPICANSGS